MTRIITRGFSVLLLLAVVGCGSKQDRLVSEGVALQTDLARDVEKGNLTEDKLKKMRVRLGEIDTELRALKLSNEERKKLDDKYGKEFTTSNERLINAYSKLDVEDRKMLDTTFYGVTHQLVPKPW